MKNTRKGRREELWVHTPNAGVYRGDLRDKDNQDWYEQLRNMGDM